MRIVIFDDLLRHTHTPPTAEPLAQNFERSSLSADDATDREQMDMKLVFKTAASVWVAPIEAIMIICVIYPSRSSTIKSP